MPMTGIEQTIVGLDVGTTKVCAVVGEMRRDGQVNVLGMGVGPTRGLSKGVVVNIGEVVSSITIAVEKAERLAGCKIGSAYVGVAGAHITSLNSRGVVSLGRSGRDIAAEDVSKAVEASRAITIPPQREVIHVIPRAFIVDGQEGVRDPVGMAGMRLEVETHIVTGTATALHNLVRCVQQAGVELDEMVLEPLASSEASLTAAEKKLGVALVDIGGGTTDIAIFIDGSIWHTISLPVGGNHLSNDISIVLRVPFDQAESLKVEHGQAQPTIKYGPLAVRANEEAEEEEGDALEVTTFSGENEQVSRRLLCEVINARVEEIFALVAKEIKRSGYDGLLPAGVVLTGGSAQLPGIAEVARNVLKMPIRVGTLTQLGGMTGLNGPAYSTAVGLLLWGLRNNLEAAVLPTVRRRQGWGVAPQRNEVAEKFKGWLREFIP